VPAGHASQLELLAVEKVPGAHSEHDALLTALNEPAVHGWQPLLPAPL
jgi:hypothetical protein